MKRLEASAAAVVTTLNVDPGTNSPSVARFRSGAAGLQSAVIRWIAPKLRSTRLGLKDGDEASTSTFPVLGSIATTAPQRWPSASSATRCAFGFTVRTMSLPLMVAPLSRSKAVWSTVSRFVLVPVR